MSKKFKSSGLKNIEEKPENKGVSLYPLTLEIALGAALQTGRAPDQKKRKKAVDKKRKRKQSRENSGRKQCD